MTNAVKAMLDYSKDSRANSLPWQP